MGKCFEPGTRGGTVDDLAKAAVVHFGGLKPELKHKLAFAYFEWIFGKLMQDPAPEELPDLLPAAWIKAIGEPALADDTAAA